MTSRRTLSKPLGTALAVLILMAAGCGPAASTPAPAATELPSGPATTPTEPAQPPAAEVTLQVGLDVDADTADPRRARNTSAWRLWELMYDGLVVMDESLEIHPALAERWENPDELTWIFHLRDGVKFHDGSDLTAEDVVFTLETIQQEDFGAPYRQLFTPIESVEAVDELTVQINLSQPYAPLLSYLDMGIVPAEAGEDLGTNPVGSGPFRFVEWERNSRIVLEANLDWWNGAPSIDRLVLNIIPDNTARALALEAGDVRFIHSPLSPQDLPSLEAAEHVEVTRMTALGYTYFNLNTQDSLLQDPRVRRGVGMLIDQDTIVNEIYQGMDQPGHAPLIPAWGAYDADIRQVTFDPEGGLALLEEAGWTDSDGDGFLDKDGQPFTLTLRTHSEDPNRVQVVEFLQNSFQGHGIQAGVEVTEFPAFLEDLLGGTYQMALVGWLNLVDPDRGMYNQFITGGANNWGGYSNPQVDELLERGRAVADPAERAQAYREAARILVEEMPYYVLTYQGYIVAHDQALEGFVPSPRGSFRSFARAALRP